MNTPSDLVGILLQIGPVIIKVFRWIIKWVVNRIKWRGISEEARKIAFAIHSYSWTNLQQTAPIISHIGVIERPEIDQIQSLWGTADIPIILHGEAGTGKSGIVLRLGQTLANNGVPVLYLRATDYPLESEPVSTA